MPDRLDQRTAFATEYKNIAGKWIPTKPLLYLQRQPTHAAAHVSVARGNPDSDAHGDRDHCSARSVAVTKAVGAVASMTTRMPPESSTVIATGADSTGAGDDGGNKGGAAGSAFCSCSIKMAGEKLTRLRATTPAACRRHV